MIEFYCQTEHPPYLPLLCIPLQLLQELILQHFHSLWNSAASNFWVQNFWPKQIIYYIFFWIMLDLLLSSSPASAVWGLCILQLIGLAGTTRNSMKILLPISVRSSRTVYKFTRKLPGKPRTSPWSPAVFRPEGLWPCWCAFRPTQEKACMLWSMNSADVLELGPPVSEYPQRDLIQFIW